MYKRVLNFDYADAEAELLPILRGRVFHVTCRSNVAPILSAGEISANVTQQCQTAFGSSTQSFFRLRGCVSVFDYRTANDEQLSTSFGKCSPWQAGGQCNYELGIFVLSTLACWSLEPWSLWEETESYSQMVVPHVEAGHPGAIPMTSVEELIEVSMRYVPSPLELAIREARRRLSDETEAADS